MKIVYKILSLDYQTNVKSCHFKKLGTILSFFNLLNEFHFEMLPYCIVYSFLHSFIQKFLF